MISDTLYLQRRFNLQGLRRDGESTVQNTSQEKLEEHLRARVGDLGDFRQSGEDYR